MDYNLAMLRGPLRNAVLLAIMMGVIFHAQAQPQQAPAPSSARILLLPRRIVSGDRATLAVLDANGRLTPGVTVTFSNGDHVVTDATGRALFAAPLKPGVIYASLSDRTARVYTTIFTPAEVATSSLEVSAAPHFATLADRFELSGRGFCGEADANAVRIDGKPALVLASSPATLLALPPGDLQPGPASIEVACGKRSSGVFPITFVELSLDANSAPLAPGEHRVLTVRVRGTTAKVPVEARNLSPEVTDLTGGNPMHVSSSGGAENAAQFELVGRQHGAFTVSMRLMATPGAPRR